MIKFGTVQIYGNTISRFSLLTKAQDVVYNRFTASLEKIAMRVCAKMEQFTRNSRTRGFGKNLPKMAPKCAFIIYFKKGKRKDI